jgi:hypothetical protein
MLAGKLLSFAEIVATFLDLIASSIDEGGRPADNGGWLSARVAISVDVVISLEDEIIRSDVALHIGKGLNSFDGVPRYMNFVRSLLL